VRSTYALARGPRELLGAWETEGRIRFGELGENAPSRTASGDADRCKHPTIACNAAGEVLVAWIEDMEWQREGTLAWQLVDAAGKLLESGRGEEDEVPPWSLVDAVALPDGRFVILE